MEAAKMKLRWNQWFLSVWKIEEMAGMWCTFLNEQQRNDVNKFFSNTSNGLSDSAATYTLFS